MTACCEAENAAQALEGIMRTNPDLALTDFALPDKNGGTHQRYQGDRAAASDPGHLDA